MKITIKGVGLELYKDTKEYVEDKIIKIVKKYFNDSSTHVDVAVKDINGPKGGVDKQIDVILGIAGEKKPVKISERDVHVWEAIDKAGDKVNKVLRRIKDKLQDKHKKIPHNYDKC